MTGTPKRRFWQIHLSTLLLAVIWLNVYVCFQVKWSREMVFEALDGGPGFTIVAEGVGWPWASYCRRPWDDESVEKAYLKARTPPYNTYPVYNDSSDMDRGLLLSAALFLFLAALTCGSSEFRIRRRERSRLREEPR